MSKESRTKLLSSKLFRIGLALLLIPVFQVGSLAYHIYSSPEAIRNPKLEHYHFRMQIVVDGQLQDFDKEEYQEAYEKGQCSVELPRHPIHFHDNKDQIVHIHWDGMTGGLVMKNYGWNFIGGPDNLLGYRFERLTQLQRVGIHGKLLPEISNREKIYVFTGDDKEFKERSFEDWKTQNLEEFFGIKSNLKDEQLGGFGTLLRKYFLPKAVAHGGVDDGHKSDEDLKRINNLLGNVVLFVQPDRPSDDMVKERFNNLEPLSESTCGG